MKQKILASVVLVISLFTTMTANAGEFTEKYPNITRMNQASIMVKFINQIAFNQAIIDSAKTSNQKKDTHKEVTKVFDDFAKNAQQENDCLKGFTKTSILENVGSQIAKEVPASELASMEQFLATPAGQKPVNSLEKIFGYLLRGDIAGFKAYKPEQDISKADEATFKAFADQHQQSITTIDKILASEPIVTQVSQFKQSCQIEN